MLLGALPEPTLSWAPSHHEQGSFRAVNPWSSTIHPFHGERFIASSQTDSQIVRCEGVLEPLIPCLGLKDIGVTEPTDKLAILDPRT